MQRLTPSSPRRWTWSTSENQQGHEPFCQRSTFTGTPSGRPTVSGQTDQPTDLTPDDDDADGYLYHDEFIATFLSVAVSQIQSITPERAAALVLRQFEGDSFDALERRLRRNHSFREALDYVEPEDVPDGTSLWRAFDELSPNELRDCLQSMCSELLTDHEHGGEFVVIESVS